MLRIAESRPKMIRVAEALWTIVHGPRPQAYPLRAPGVRQARPPQASRPYYGTRFASPKEAATYAQQQAKTGAQAQAAAYAQQRAAFDAQARYQAEMANARRPARGGHDYRSEHARPPVREQPVQGFAYTLQDSEPGSPTSPTIDEHFDSPLNLKGEHDAPAVREFKLEWLVALSKRPLVDASKLIAAAPAVVAPSVGEGAGQQVAIWARPPHVKAARLETPADDLGAERLAFINSALLGMMTRREAEAQHRAMVQTVSSRARPIATIKAAPPVVSQPSKAPPDRGNPSPARPVPPPAAQTQPHRAMPVVRELAARGTRSTAPRAPPTQLQVVPPPSHAARPVPHQPVHATVEAGGAHLTQPPPTAVLQRPHVEEPVAHQPIHAIPEPHHAHPTSPPTQPPTALHPTPAQAPSQRTASPHARVGDASSTAGGHADTSHRDETESRPYKRVLTAPIGTASVGSVYKRPIAAPPAPPAARRIVLPTPHAPMQPRVEAHSQSSREASGTDDSDSSSDDDSRASTSVETAQQSSVEAQIAAHFAAQFAAYMKSPDPPSERRAYYGALVEVYKMETTKAWAMAGQRFPDTAPEPSIASRSEPSSASRRSKPPLAIEKRAGGKYVFVRPRQ